MGRQRIYKVAGLGTVQRHDANPRWWCAFDNDGGAIGWDFDTKRDAIAALKDAHRRGVAR